MRNTARRTRVLLLALVLAGCTGNDRRIRNIEFREAVKTRRMPNLVGLELSEDPDWLRKMQQQFGVQETISEASESFPEGKIVRQRPAPGAPLEEGAPWTLVVSDGGPVIQVEALPAKDRELAISLGVNGPLRQFETAAGNAYKNDQWLFAWDCAAVDAAFRISRDARYDTRCVGRTERLN